MTDTVKIDGMDLFFEGALEEIKLLKKVFERDVDKIFDQKLKFELSTNAIQYTLTAKWKAVEIEPASIVEMFSTNSEICNAFIEHHMFNELLYIGSEFYVVDSEGVAAVFLDRHFSKVP